MKPSWSSFFFLAVVIGFGAGCGSGPYDPLNDPHTFAGMNAAAIENDCGQTLACLQSQNMQTDPQFQANCQRQEADKLDQDGTAQADFLEATTRCRQRTSCEYLNNCIKLKVTGYGQQQMDKVTYMCQQKVQCQIDQGHSPSNPQQAMNNCIAQSLGELYLYSSGDRANFELKWMPCTQLTTCAFVQCFPY